MLFCENCAIYIRPEMSTVTVRVANGREHNGSGGWRGNMGGICVVCKEGIELIESKGR
jgi:hypothetical protein